MKHPDYINIAEHHLGLAALSIIMHPEQQSETDQMLDLASNAASHAKHQKQDQIDPARWQALINAGTTLRALAHNPANSEPEPPEDQHREPLTDGWETTSDQLGQQRQVPNRHYVVHPHPATDTHRFGFTQDGITTWDDEHFPSHQSAFDAAEAHISSYQKQLAPSEANGAPTPPTVTKPA